MAIRKKEDVYAFLKDRIGDDDASLNFMEDFDETWTDMEGRTADKEDWRARYEANDAEWRKRYKERFFSSGEEAKEDQEEQVKEDGENRSFDSLFEEREG